MAKKKAAVRLCKDATPGELAAIAETLRQSYDEILDWLESLRLPRDTSLAAQIALVEYGEFATADECGEIPLDNLVELIKVVAARKEWERRIAERKDRRPPKTPEQSRDDEPTAADLLVGRVVLAGMSRNPSVESFRAAMRAKGQRGSNRKFGKVFSQLRGERLKK